VAEFPEYRRRRPQFPGLPGDPRGLGRDPQPVQVAGQATVVLDQVDHGVVLVP
jgi:hypothetical protein